MLQWRVRTASDTLLGLPRDHPPITEYFRVIGISCVCTTRLVMVVVDVDDPGLGDLVVGATAATVDSQPVYT